MQEKEMQAIQNSMESTSKIQAMEKFDMVSNPVQHSLCSLTVPGGYQNPLRVQPREGFGPSSNRTERKKRKQQRQARRKNRR
jgi:hypothetical protein